MLNKGLSFLPVMLIGTLCFFPVVGQAEEQTAIYKEKATATNVSSVEQRQVVNGVEITGNTLFKTNDLLNLLKTQPGSSLDKEKIQADSATIDSLYAKYGYVFSKVIGASIDKKGIVHFQIYEGKLEDILLQGNTKTKDKVILREIVNKKGVPFNANLARVTLQRLRNTGFFGDVSSRFYQGKDNPNDVIMSIEVEEQKTGLITLGAGYSSSNSVVGTLSYNESNLGGRGDQFGVSWEFGGTTGHNNYMLSYTHPWVNKLGDSLGFSIYDHEYNYDDYNRNGDSVAEYYKRTKAANVTYAFGRRLFIKDYLTFEVKKTDYTEYRSGYDYNQVPNYLDDNFGQTHSLSWSHVFDNRDNVFDPTKGKRLLLTGTVAGHGMGGDFSFYKLQAETRNYYKVGHAQVVALRLMGGIGFGNIPGSELFTIGGGNDLRGFEDDQFRGSRFYEGTVEYRYPIHKKVEGVVFADLGSAWGGTDNLFWYEDSKKLYSAGGLGVRIKTPIGPINLNYAYGTNGGKFHFTFGGQF